uniref:DYW domain-containing protein n=1 Tax=Oryza glumipatula TaxID=40148 RepID=A0A0E0BP83_9ORYZ
MGIWFHYHPLCQRTKALTLACSGIYFATRAFCDKPNHRIVHKDKNLVRVERDLIDAFTLHELLQLCAKRRSLLVGKSCHGLAIHFGLVTDTVTCNILINLYTKCGQNDCARRVFDAMSVRSIISWNTMIAGYTHNREDVEALKLFSRMHREGTQMTEFTLSSTLCACAAKYAIIECKQLHTIAIKLALDSSSFVGTAFLDVYAKCNMIKDACWVFENMPEKTSVTWSSLFAGFVQNGLHEEVLCLFQSTQREGMQLTEFTVSSILSTCASLALIIEGTQVHAVIVKHGFHRNLFVATSLVDVYARCGQIEKSYEVFADMEEKNVVLWNAMIASFSRHAHSWEAMILFEKMQQVGIFPNEVTYLSILSACSHTGLVEEGRHYFNLLLSDRTAEPNVLHYSCMVDVLGRSGKTDEAWKLLDKMPFEPTASMWGSLLGSSRIHKNIRLARIAAEQLFRLEPENGGNHVLLSNVYAASGNWENVVVARKYLRDSGAKKEMGRSWIEAKGKIHVFVAGEREHPGITDVYNKLEEIYHEMRKISHRANTQCDLHDVHADQKEELLKHHSEKLAFAFGLISLPPNIPITIYKNLRICGDCHSFMKINAKSLSEISIDFTILRMAHVLVGTSGDLGLNEEYQSSTSGALIIHCGVGALVVHVAVHCRRLIRLRLRAAVEVNAEQPEPPRRRRRRRRAAALGVCVSLRLSCKLFHRERLTDVIEKGRGGDDGREKLGYLKERSIQLDELEKHPGQAGCRRRRRGGGGMQVAGARAVTGWGRAPVSTGRRAGEPEAGVPG